MRMPILGLDLYIYDEESYGEAYDIFLDFRIIYEYIGDITQQTSWELTFIDGSIANIRW